MNRVDNVNWPPYRDWKADVSSVSASSICSDEGLTLESSAFQSPYGGQFTLSLSLPSSIRSDEGLTLETSAFQSLYGGQFTLSLSLPSSIRSDEGLTLETSAFQSLCGGQFALSTPLINQIFVYRFPTDAAPQFLQKLIPLTGSQLLVVDCVKNVLDVWLFVSLTGCLFYQLTDHLND